MDILEDFGYDLDIELFNLIENVNPERTYNVRPKIDHFNFWNDVEFFNRFRLSKTTVRRLLDTIEERIRNRTERNADRAVSAMDRLLLTLRFLATGDFYITMGDFRSIHKTTAGRVIKNVLQVLCTLLNDSVYLPQTEDDQRKTKKDFLNISRFPRVLGAIDCTHIKIISPGGDNAEIYRNRKGYFSLNCQVICNAKLKICDLVTRVILGDRGYALQSYLLTPLEEPQNEAERLYNEAQIRTRNAIERCFGVWKKRFPILSGGIRCKIQMAQMIIVACAILHNLAIDNNESNFENDAFEEFEENIVTRERYQANDARTPFIDYFRQLL